MRVFYDVSLHLNDHVLLVLLSMLGDFGDEMDQTSSRMDSVLKKLEKVSHMTSSEFTHTHTDGGTIFKITTYCFLCSTSGRLLANQTQQRKVSIVWIKNCFSDSNKKRTQLFFRAEKSVVSNCLCVYLSL